MNTEPEQLEKYNDFRIVYEWLSIDANRNKLTKILVDELTWNVFRSHATVIDFTTEDLENGIMYCSLGGEWLCLKKSITI